MKHLWIRDNQKEYGAPCDPRYRWAVFESPDDVADITYHMIEVDATTQTEIIARDFIIEELEKQIKHLKGQL